MSEPERDRWGRYKLTNPLDPDAEIRPWTRATTIAGTLDDKYGLHAWEIRQVIIGLVKSPDLLDLAYASDPEDRQQLEEIAENAKKFAGGDVNSNRGTALHRFTQRLDAGQLSRSPRQWQEHLDAYVAFKEANGIQTHPNFIERITVVPELETAGTMDRIVKHEGVPKIADLKTGSIGYDGIKIAIQLAIYAHGAGLWDEKTGKWLPMPNVSQTEGLVIHLPQGRAEDGQLIQPQLYRVDLVQGWKLAKWAYEIREIRKSKELMRGNVIDAT